MTGERCGVAYNTETTGRLLSESAFQRPSSRHVGKPVRAFVSGRLGCADTGQQPHPDVNRRPGHLQVGIGRLRPLRRSSVPSVTVTSSFCYRVRQHPPASPSPLTTVCAIRTARRITTWFPSNFLCPKCHHQFTDAGQTSTARDTQRGQRNRPRSPGKRSNAKLRQGC